MNLQGMNLGPDWVPLIFCMGLIAWGSIVLLHILFAVAVGADAEKLRKSGDGTELVGSSTWALAVLVGGVFVAVAYWAIHHSRLRRTKTALPTPAEPS